MYIAEQVVTLHVMIEVEYSACICDIVCVIG